METIYLSLGSNLGNRLFNLKKAIFYLQKEVDVLKVSSVYKTKPIGYIKQPFFYNIVVEIASVFCIKDLFLFLKSVEKKMGRKTRIKWGPRNIDIDIILYGSLCIKENIAGYDTLYIPHMSMHKRAFVLVPLFELVGDIMVPHKKKTLSYLISCLKDQGIEKLSLKVI